MFKIHDWKKSLICKFQIEVEREERVLTGEKCRYEFVKRQTLYVEGSISIVSQLVGGGIIFLNNHKPLPESLWGCFQSFINL